MIVLKKKTLCMALALLMLGLLAAAVVPRAQEALAVSGDADDSPVWIIDAGHGGEDGGAVASDGTKESELNLALAQRLSLLLGLLGEETRMTRASDVSLHDPSAATLRQKKRSDLAYRVALVNETNGAVLVSLHQNSLPSSKKVHGAQVFYAAHEQSADLAQRVQRSLNAHVNVGNEKRETRIDESIYLMKNVRVPAILIECGFLSNDAETALLKDAEYQKKLALSIAAGLLNSEQ